MKLTLRQLLHSEVNRGKTLLELKRELQKLKNSGEVFFIQDVASLELDEPFDFYFYLSPSEYSKKNAFPVRIDCYSLLPKDEEKRKKELEKYYKEYYLTNPQKGLFKRYEYKTFKTSEYVWFYHE